MKKGLMRAVLLSFALSGSANAATLRLKTVLNQVKGSHPLAQAAGADVDEAEALALSARGAFDLRTEAEGSFFPAGKYTRPYGSLALKQPTTAGGLELWAKYQNGADFAPYNGGYVSSEGGKASIGLVLPLLRGSQIDPKRLKRYVTRVKSDVARQKRRLTEAKLLSSAAKAWWSWVIAGKKLEAYRKLVEQAQVRQDFIQEQVASGAVSEVELEDNKRLLSQRKAKLAGIELSFVEKSIELGMFRRTIQGEPIVAEASELPPLPHLTAESPPSVSNGTTPLAQTPQILAFDLSLKILKRELKGARNGTLPQLDFGLSGSQSFGATRPYSDIDDSVTETTAGGTLTFSWDLQRREARGRAAALRARHRSISQMRRLALDRLTLRQKARMMALSAQFRSAQLSRDATTHAEKVADAERTSFQLGQSSVLQVNLREQAYLSTYISELEAILEFQLAWLTLQELHGETEAAAYLPPRSN